MQEIATGDHAIEDVFLAVVHRVEIAISNEVILGTKGIGENRTVRNALIRFDKLIDGVDAVGSRGLAEIVRPIVTRARRARFVGEIRDMPITGGIASTIAPASDIFDFKTDINERGTGTDIATPNRRSRAEIDWGIQIAVDITRFAVETDGIENRPVLHVNVVVKHLVVVGIEVDQVGRRNRRGSRGATVVLDQHERAATVLDDAVVVFICESDRALCAGTPSGSRGCIDLVIGKGIEIVEGAPRLPQCQETVGP